MFKKLSLTIAIELGDNNSVTAMHYGFVDIIQGYQVESLHTPASWTVPSIDQPIGFGRACEYISERKMLHTFCIFLQSCRKTNQCHIYQSRRNRAPIIDYREQQKEKERQLTYN
jgi:hypothetical protein